MAAMVWFLVRVLPKPSRAAYPCQRVAAPLASGFVVWTIGAIATVFAFRRARHFLGQSRVLVGSFCAVVALAALAFTATQTEYPSFAQAAPLAVAGPVGTPQGVIPGRVTWAWDPSATNANCTNGTNNYWWQDANTKQAAVDAMLSKSLQQLTGTYSDADAWVAIFKQFNKSKRGMSATGYTAGEKIVIKVNLCSGAVGNYPNYTKTSKIAMPDTSPQMMRALVKSLINNVGSLNPTDITIGDPNRPFFQQFYDMMLAEPLCRNINYLDSWGTNGRKLNVPSSKDVLLYSDGHGDGNGPDANNNQVYYSNTRKLPQAYVDATYMINLAALKAHEGTGVTLCAKNHFGSQCGTAAGSNHLGAAFHLHKYRPSDTSGYGKYRVLVDMMANKHLGGKTALYLIDGLWGGYYSMPDVPNKWKSAPFNGHWPSSLLASQDPVAIECVGLDFLKEEYQTKWGYVSTGAWDKVQTNPNSINGVEDYLLQAASSAYWPSGFTYHPDGGTTAIPSLGVYDRWNNSTDKKYAKNLNPTATNGIELVKIQPASPVIQLPGVLPVVDYKFGGEGVGYHDTTKGNSGATYRSDDVDIQACTDAGAAAGAKAFNVGWTAAGEWLAYDVNVAQAGNYSLTARVSSGVAGNKTLSVTVDGNPTTAFTIALNSGWSTWADVVQNNIYLPAGKHELRLVITTGNFNLSYLNVKASSNLAPISKAGAAQTVNVNSLVTLDGSGSSDPDNGPSPLNYSWIQTGGTAVTLSNASAVKPTFTPTVAGTYTFKLVVGDGLASSTSSVSITAGTVVITNLLLNGDFSNGLTNWSGTFGGTAAGTFVIDNLSAKIAPTAAGTNTYDIQVVQMAALTAMKVYTLNFDLKAAATGKNLKVVIEHNGTPYTKYLEKVLQFTQAANTTQHFTVSWTQSANETAAKIGFHFGTYGTAAAWLDNVILTSN